MKDFFSNANFALVDVGSSKIALVVPQQGADSAERHLVPRCCLVEPVKMETLASDSEIARAEAFRRVRLRAEAMLGLRLRKVFLLATEETLELVAPSHEQDEQQTSRKHGDEPQDHRTKGKGKEETIILNAVATDRNKRPLSFYAMRKRRWQFYTRLASYAGVSVEGFVFPAVALGQSLLVHRRTLANAAERTKTKKVKTERQAHSIPDERSFVVLDMGARTTGLAVFAEGLPCACRSWAFGAVSITAALAESFVLTPSRASTLQRRLVLSESFLNGVLSPSSSPVDPVFSERRFPRKEAFSKKPQQAPPLDALRLAASQEGALRLVVSLYGSFFAEVSRFLERHTPAHLRDAPVYATGGGSLLAGSLSLASRLLSRGVFPYPCLVTGVPTHAFGERIAASCALACLSVLSRGGVLLRAPAILSSMSPRSRHLKTFPSQQEETSHA